MLKEDKETLRKLVDSYGMSSVVSSLAEVAIDKAHEMSDMNLKENASDWANYSDWLDDVARGIAD